MLAQAARASQLGFRATEAARLALCAASAEELSEKLLQAAAAIEKSPETPLVAPTGIFYSAAPAAPGRVAFVFPGQGSQYVGMGADLAMSIDAARAAWDRAAAHTFDGRGVHQVVFPAPVFTDAERDAQGRALTATEWAQPALGDAERWRSCACCRRSACARTAWPATASARSRRCTRRGRSTRPRWSGWRGGAASSCARPPRSPAR